MLVVVVVVGIIVSSAACARAPSSSVTHAVYGGYDARRFAADEISIYPRGARLGYVIGRSDTPYSGFIEGGYAQAQTIDFSILSLGIGGRVAAVRHQRFEVGALASLGFQGARFDDRMNGNSLLAIGVGGYAHVRVHARVALTVTASAHAFADVTPPTTCNDGSTSQSTGQGTCSHHDGIAFYNEMIGAGTGLDALLGLSISLGAGARASQ